MTKVAARKESVNWLKTFFRVSSAAFFDDLFKA